MMTVLASSPSLAQTTFRSAMRALMWLFAAMIPFAGTIWLWQLARQHLHLRTVCLAAGIGAALTSTLFLAVAIRQIDRVLTAYSPRLALRVTLKLNKRLLLLLQILAMGLALASAYLLALNYKIPAF